MADEVRHKSLYKPYYPFIERAGLTSRTMLGGAKVEGGLGAFNSFAATRATSHEMARWTSGSTWGSNAARGLDKLSGKDKFGRNRLMGGSPSIMGTPLAPSSWMTSVRLANNPDGMYSSDMMKMFSPGAYGEADSVASKLPTVLKSRAGKVPTDFYDPYFGEGVRVGDAGKFAPRWEASKTMSAVDSTRWINQALKIGAGPGTSSIVKDAAMGTMFKMNPELLDMGGQMAASEKYASLMGSKFGLMRGAGDLLSKGNVLAEAGADAMGGATTFGTLATTGIGVASLAFRAIGVGLIAKDVAETAYKVGEAYYYKLPKAMMESAWQQITRESFAGGDASLLTGVPANNRMRAVQSIQMSRMNARSALGNEASLLSGHFQ